MADVDGVILVHQSGHVPLVVTEAVIEVIAETAATGMQSSGKVSIELVACCCLSNHYCIVTSQ